MIALKRHFDLVLLGILIAGYLLVAGQRLGTVPVPDTDESYMLQASYEMLYRGHLGWPLLRFQGGNIDSNLHSFMPVHFVIQSGFLRVFGWGLLQGRVFNLITASLMLILLYLIARKLFDWRVGLISVLLVVSDVTFLMRSRYLRNDYSAAMFALLAFYLYETAERRKGWRWFVASGLAAGAALMSHTVGFYMVAGIALLIVIRRGWRALTTGPLYQYGLGALAVSAYEIVSDVIDYKNVLLQNRGDNRHFRVFDAMGWWRNVGHEPRRYKRWFAGGAMFSDVPRTLVHLFALLAALAGCYLIARLVLRLRRGDAISEPRVRVLILSLVAVTFLAVVTGQKAIYYMAHLTPWFGLCAAILVVDAVDLSRRLGAARPVRWKGQVIAYRASACLLIVAALAVGYLGLRQTARYLRAVRNPDVALFEQFKTAIRSLVPEGACPISVREPVLWLAFPEYDLCFATLQKRTMKVADIHGKEYALIVAPRWAPYRIGGVQAMNHPLLGELTNSAYGSYQVYYTGTDPKWLSVEPVRYQFFGARCGYVSDKDIANAREIWSADSSELKQCGAPGVLEPDGLAIDSLDQHARGEGLTELCAVELKPDTIYQAAIKGNADAEVASVAIVDEKSGLSLLAQTPGGPVLVPPFNGLFKTGANSRFKVSVRALTIGDGRTIKITRLSIREVAPVYR